MKKKKAKRLAGRAAAAAVSLVMAMAYLPVADGGAFAKDKDACEDIGMDTISLTAQQAATLDADLAGKCDSAVLSKADPKAGDFDMSALAASAAGATGTDSAASAADTAGVSASGQRGAGTDPSAVSEGEPGFAPMEAVEQTPLDLMTIPVDKTAYITGDQAGETGDVTSTLDVQLDKSTGVAKIGGRVNGDTFEGLYVDGEKVDVDVAGRTLFGTAIDMKDYPVGMHTIYAVLKDHNEPTSYVFNQYGVPTLVYESPSNKLDYFLTKQKLFAYSYGGEKYSHDPDCGVYLDYRQAGGNWVESYGACSTDPSVMSVPNKQLKPSTKYDVRTCFGKKGRYGGVSYFIKGAYSPVKSVKTSGKALKIKSISTSKAKVKYAGWILTPYYNGKAGKPVPIYYTSFDLTLKLKEKPAATGIYIGASKVKGNKKTYKVHKKYTGAKKDYIGKSMKIEFISYQSTVYQGYSPKVTKKVKIR